MSAGPGHGVRARTGWPAPTGPSGEIRGRLKSAPGAASRVRRAPAWVSMTATSSRRPPQPSYTDQPVTACRPSGVSSKWCSSSAAPARWSGPVVLRQPGGTTPRSAPPGDYPRNPRPPIAVPRRGRPGLAMSGPTAVIRQPELVRTQVVIPVPDRGRLVQDRGHAGVRAALPLLRVVGDAAGPGQHRAGERGQRGVRRGGQPGDTAGRRGELARFPARRGQQPQRLLPGRAPAGAGVGWPVPGGTGPGRAASAARPPGGPGRADRNSSEPPGRNAGLSSPSADLVSRAAGRAAAEPAASR